MRLIARAAATRALVLAGVVVVVATLMGAQPAAAADCEVGGGAGNSGIGGSVTCEGSGTRPPGPKGTTAPRPGGGTTLNIDVPPPPCGYEDWMSGTEMAAYATNFSVPMYPPPAADWQAHADDAAGRWSQAACHWGPEDGGTPDTLDLRALQFRNAHPPVFGEVPPPPPIPVDDLVTRVQDFRDVPSPVVSVNPEQQTVVGLRTWVWPTGGQPQPVSARAASGPNWAEVTAIPGKLVVSADNAEVGTCDRAPAYTTGAPDSATDCYATFSRSSAGTGTATIRTSISWTVTLTTSDGRNEVLDATFPSATATQIAVAEVQSILR